MMRAIKEAFRRFVARNIVADDPYPARSWLDQQNMPPEPRITFAPGLHDPSGFQP
ncbi:hypothetical protein [Arthrobacter oryzae]|uniref:hypothetical protein n=1 Tax=Arthrobacter oryzae TaxID=409290 RepID=UPI00273B24E4|nr:hypothetical protein [Arthrobacter oryzae]WLQ07099.1 hypothetical protein Q8Z05_02800 [Arthrobacter oryzae]